MKKSNILPLIIAMAVIIMSSCGGGGKAEKVELSEKGELLISKTWAPDLNANIKGKTDAVDSASGIKADIKLEKDVKKMADFMAGTLRFVRDSKDPSKLSYERKYGKGILSTSVVGYWNFNEDESAIIMREWDSEAGAEKAPVTWEIIELTEEKLVVKKGDSMTEEIYLAQ